MNHLGALPVTLIEHRTTSIIDYKFVSLWIQIKNSLYYGNRN